jgi:GTP-binding protein HflX
MSQQAGGGAGGGGARRGIGEKKTELDRRTIRAEIRDLEKRIDKLARERNLRRNKRTRNQIKNISLVGYTNAGKSTIMNALTSADTLVKDALFATLDPISRKLHFNDGSMALLTDTVGFISNLPHEFVKAFRSTLEETIFSDLILHIVDGSSPVSHEQFNVVNSVLDSIGIKDTPIITVINKADKDIFEFIPRSKHMVVVSAKTGKNMDKLKELIHKLLFLSNSEKLTVSTDNVSEQDES